MSQTFKMVYSESFSIHISAQSATATPPLGPTLGQRGINIKEFCDKYNAITAMYNKGYMIGVTVYCNRQKQYSILLKSVVTDKKKLLSMSEKMEFKLKVAYELAKMQQSIFDEYKRISIHRLVKSIYSSILSVNCH